jgi:hypothetical protein
MSARISDDVWSVEELVVLLDRAVHVSGVSDILYVGKAGNRDGLRTRRIEARACNGRT